MTSWTTDPRLNFVNTFLSEMPEGIGKTELSDKIAYFIKDYINAGKTPTELPNGLRKIEGNQVLFYWYEDAKGNFLLGAELEKSPFAVIVREVGKVNKGKPPFASDLYSSILKDLGGSVRLMSDTQLSEEGLNIWKKLLSQGFKVSIYDNQEPGSTYTKVESADDLDKFFKHDDRSYRRWQYVISESIHSIEISHLFEMRRYRELNKFL